MTDKMATDKVKWTATATCFMCEKPKSSHHPTENWCPGDGVPWTLIKFAALPQLGDTAECSHCDRRIEFVKSSLSGHHHWVHHEGVGGIYCETTAEPKAEPKP